jgi:adenosyl cobinamide kinase/adenosyl cobinamide phosphate guanylyltransferase
MEIFLSVVLLPKESGLTFVTGPAWAGKSQGVQTMTSHFQALNWIGTADTRDQFLESRVQNLKENRPESWTTIDCPNNLAAMIQKSSSETSPIVIDSWNLWLANRVLDLQSKYSVDQIFDQLEQETMEVLDHLALQKSNRPIVVVSAELGASPPPENAATYVLRRICGQSNQILAQHASIVLAVQCGIFTRIK